MTRITKKLTRHHHAGSPRSLLLCMLMLMLMLAISSTTTIHAQPQDFGCINMGRGDELCVVASPGESQSCQAEWNGAACESCTLCEGPDSNSTTSTFAYQCQGAAEVSGDGLDNDCVNYDCDAFCMGVIEEESSTTNSTTPEEEEEGTTTSSPAPTPTPAPAASETATAPTPTPIPEGATQFTLFGDSEIVCSDSLDNVCTAPVEECSPDQDGPSPVFVAGNNVNVGGIEIEGGVWTIVGGYTISFPGAVEGGGCVVTCVGGGCVCDVCAAAVGPDEEPETEQPTTEAPSAEEVAAPTASPTFSEQPVAVGVVDDGSTPADGDEPADNSSTTSSTTAMTISSRRVVANLVVTTAVVVWGMVI